MRLLHGGRCRYLGTRFRLIGAVAAIIITCLTLSQREWYGSIRELVFDEMLSRLSSAPGHSGSIVVDIDAASIEAIGAWPWRRDKLAGLLSAIAAEGPEAVGLDILLEGDDELSPAAMARKLAAETADPDIAALANRLTDGDRDLARAIGAANTVLGVVLSPNPTEEKAIAPVLVRGRFDTERLWQADGILAPTQQLMSPAKGRGLIAIAGDADGSVRRIPMLAVAGQSLIPGLAVELQRAGRGAAAIIASQSPGILQVGDLKLALPGDGMLRLVPTKPKDWPRRTVSAKHVLDGNPDARRLLKGAIVLVGSSAPEAGGLRAVAEAVLAPTVQLHADAYQQLSARLVPLRPVWLERAELLVAVFAGILGAMAGGWLGLRTGATLIFGSVILLLASAAMIYSSGSLLIDLIVSAACTMVCFAVATLTKAADTMRREEAIRKRFQQHLAPEVVRRIIAQPELLRLAGEVREVTALFTDVEGFTAMTDRAEPQKLIAVLDAYFDGVSRIVIDHGGLIDKIVGDAVHALFNAPLDLADHPRAAFRCALAIEAFADGFRDTAPALDLGFGRTRMGLETGPAIVGDVGGSRKLDYTAHGNAVNAAARLEALNKDFGTALCIGPGAASRIGQGELRPLGSVMIRGRTQAQDIFSVWPPGYSPDDMAIFTRAMMLSETNRDASIEALQTLAVKHKTDAVLAKLYERLAPLNAGDLSVHA